MAKGKIDKVTVANTDSDTRKIKPSIAKKKGEFVLDRSNYLPSFFTMLANATSRGGSKVYLKLFGIGVIEWRILSVLTLDPGYSAIDICEAIALDKASASRAIKSMEEAELLRSEPVANSARRRALFITDKGRDLHNRILPVVAARELKLLAGISEEERQFLLFLLRKIATNLDQLAQFEEELMSGKIASDTLSL